MRSTRSPSAHASSAACATAACRRAADSVLAKVTAALPDARRPAVSAAPFFVSDGSNAVPEGITLSDLRVAIRETRKLRIAYADAQGQRSERTIWPLAMAYYVDVTLLGAWCELREDFRNFRVDRIAGSVILEARFSTDGGRLIDRWFARQKDLPHVA